MCRSRTAARGSAANAAAADAGSPSVASPSTVGSHRPEHCTVSIRHERTAWPSTSTVHDPHTPCSQARLVPVRRVVTERVGEAVTGLHVDAVPITVHPERHHLSGTSMRLNPFPAGGRATWVVASRGPGAGCADEHREHVPPVFDRAVRFGPRIGLPRAAAPASPTAPSQEATDNPASARSAVVARTGTGPALAIAILAQAIRPSATPTAATAAANAKLPWVRRCSAKLIPVPAPSSGSRTSVTSSWAVRSVRARSVKRLRGGHHASPRRSVEPDLGVQRDRDRAPLGGRMRPGEAAGEGAARPDRRVRHVGGGTCQQRADRVLDHRPFQVGVAHERAQHQMPVVDAVSHQLFHAVDVDEQGGTGPPVVQVEHQALPAGEHLRGRSVLIEQRDGLVHRAAAW